MSNLEEVYNFVVKEGGGVKFVRKKFDFVCDECLSCDE